MYSDIEGLLNSLNESGIDLLFIIDNSPLNSIEEEIRKHYSHFEYIHQSDNPGFGAAHNVGLKKAIALGSNYHFVINPDVLLESQTIGQMVDFMDSNPSIGMAMPQILNTDESIQFLPKLLPSPFSIIKRILNRRFKLFTSFIEKYELRNISPNIMYDTPVISGCFTLLRISSLKEVGLYDDRFFMYLEDWDLSRRMNAKYRTVYFPGASVIHGYESGSNKNFGLFKVHMRSYILYFRKWGWLFDEKRIAVNRKTLNQFKPNDTRITHSV